MQSQLEQLEKDFGIEWQEYRFDELFDNIVQGSRLKKQDQIAGNMPFVMAGVTNTGIVDYIGNRVRVFPKNSLTIDIFGNVFYRDYEYGMGDDTGAYWNTDNHIPKFAMLYIATTMQKFMSGKFDFGHKLRSSRSLGFKIKLPTVTKKGKHQIAFDFIEKFIATLNAERLATLNAYLTVTGLKDYTLTEDEQTALNELGTVTWGTFNLVSLFSVKNTHCILSRDIAKNSGTVPYLTAGQTNNAVGTYINFDSKQIDEGNCIFIGGKTFVVTYQETDFFSNDSHNLALYYKESKKRTKSNQLFMATSIYKSLSPLYSWGDSISNKKIQKDKIQLPINPDKTPNYDYMTRVISAMQKVVIKNVVDYLDVRIEKTGDISG